jgi:pimeloyl-ACP methyl ester carboxylesterase
MVRPFPAPFCCVCHRRLLFLSVLSLAASFTPRPKVWAEEAGEERVVVTVAKAVVREATDPDFRRWLRNKVWDEEDEARYGLMLDDDWEEVAARSPEQPLVILVHGYNSTCARNSAVLEPVRRAGYPCGAFSYPNDWKLSEAAARMSQQLKLFAKEHPDQKLALVTHSMGGLVARACLENPALDPGCVTRLVMIAPPSQGTRLASFAVATDIWEHWLGRASGAPWTRWRDSVIDGLGEAAEDLEPGSPFLAKLNARPRNAHVHYAILLGTAAGVSQPEMDWLRLAVRETGGHCPGLKDCSSKVDEILSDMDELVEGKGDGIVAVKRGRLKGVDDLLILPFGHLNCTDKADCDAVKQVQQEVLARLR